ncbi:hypothetical protein HUJ05_003855 [Dendroctonus ponderosae]|nr:hypothetical protein HUJ05_003855 [Dendroctonus ponderosae]
MSQQLKNVVFNELLRIPTPGNNCIEPPGQFCLAFKILAGVKQRGDEPAAHFEQNTAQLMPLSMIYHQSLKRLFIKERIGHGCSCIIINGRRDLRVSAAAATLFDVAVASGGPRVTTENRGLETASISDFC